MKKLSKSLFSLTLFASLFLAGCKDPVFYYINNDVASEKATVCTVIRSIARYTTPNNDEYIVTVGNNGFIYKRVYDADAETDKWVTDTQKHGAWTTVGESQLPFDLHRYNYVNKTHIGQQIIKIISDADSIYLFTVSYEDNDDGKSTPNMIYVYGVSPKDSDGDGKWDTLEESDWKNLNLESDGETAKIDMTKAFYEDGDYVTTSFNAFATNSPNKANRKAYFRIGIKNSSSKIEHKYYNLPDFTEATEITSFVDSEKAPANVAANGAAFFNGNVVFFTTAAVTTDESLGETATTLFWGEDNYLRYTTDLANIPETKVDTTYTITSIAYCSDAVLLGLGETKSGSTNLGGIEKVQLKADGTPETELGTFTTNAQTQLLTSYLLSIVFNTNPADAELDSALYAGLYFIGSSSSSSVSFNNEGLWSYYPKRGNWNRE